MKMYDKNLQQEQKECEVCQKTNGGYRMPSALVFKMLHKYKVRCMTCNKAFDLRSLAQHEVICQQSVCSNELCGASLTDAGTQGGHLVLDDLDESVD